MRKVVDFFAILTLMSAVICSCARCDGKDNGSSGKQEPEEPIVTTSYPFTDMVLCYGGSRHRAVYQWNEDRFSKYVTYTDKSGKEHWLFDAFLCIEFESASRPDGNNYSYCTGFFKNKTGESAGKAQWQELIDYWFDPTCNLVALDNAVENAKATLGAPKEKRKVVMVMPDPILYKYFEDVTSSTTYWGKLNGKTLDFNVPADRIAAYEWYIDEVRKGFKAANFKNIELDGFYIVSEDLVTPEEGWSYELKKLDLVIPSVSDYIHSFGQKIYWIPYRKAAGYKMGKKFKLDYVWMQPNYLWNGEKYPLEESMLMIKGADVGMEMEIDANVLDGMKDSELYRMRYRKYMQFAKQYGLYGKKPFTYYIGNNAVYDLAVSDKEVDQSMYFDLCDFVVDNPLRK